MSHQLDSRKKWTNLLFFLLLLRQFILNFNSFRSILVHWWTLIKPFSPFLGFSFVFGPSLDVPHPWPLLGSSLSVGGLWIFYNYFLLSKVSIFSIKFSSFIGKFYISYLRARSRIPLSNPCTRDNTFLVIQLLLLHMVLPIWGYFPFCLADVCDLLCILKHEFSLFESSFYYVALWYLATFRLYSRSLIMSCFLSSSFSFCSTSNAASLVSRL